MIIWLEALTAKQALLMSYLYEKLTKQKLDVIVTTRHYDYTTGIFAKRNIPFIAIGKHGGEELEEKLRQSLLRQLELLGIIREYKPNVHASFVSPDSTRVAFGLGIPIVLFTDTPHSYFVNKLAIPLADRIIAPICTRDSWIKKGYEIKNFKFFKGVFEVTWTINFKPDKSELEKADLEEYKYVIVRSEEKKASYYPKYGLYYSEPTFITKLLDYIIKELDMRVIFFPRYHEQKEYVAKRYDKRIIVPEESLFLQHLEYYAYAVVTGGCTMAVESSLLGTPSITLFPLKIETVEWLKNLGFPIVQIADLDRNFQYITRFLEMAENFRIKTGKLLRNLENPVPLMVNEIVNVAKNNG